MILAFLAAAISPMTPAPSVGTPSPGGDWLLGRANRKSEVVKIPKGLVLSNGLVSRTFRLTPGCATVAIDDLMNGESLLRAPGPEAILEIDGKRISVGGLEGQPDRAFTFEKWLDAMHTPAGALRFVGYTTGETVVRLPWLRKRHAATAEWPPRGKALSLLFETDGVRVEVRYEIYDGIPLIGKQISVTNTGTKEFHLTGFETERMSLVEGESSVDNEEGWRKPPVTVLTDYSFAGIAMGIVPPAVTWQKEPEYTTQVNYLLQTPCRLVVHAPVGPDAVIAPGKTLDTFSTWMLVHDSYDRERQGLAVRKLYRTLAPWVTENPIMLHLTSVDPEVVHRAIDQAADVGFEMIIFSFGSGLDMEDVSDANLHKFRDFADYAHRKGLDIGGYSLLASRHIDDADDVIDPKTGKPGGAAFGSSPCLGSIWGQNYFAHLKRFIEATGFDLLEHDGSYPGDVCASTTHPGHRGLADSQWTQYATISGFYRWCRDRGMYLNVPDTYFLAGSNKTGMGYRETNWSLPREQQHIHARQNMYDGTWEKPPTMGWMFTPLVEYQGGGAEATIEPLREHLEDYGLHLMNNFGFGVQACYRGPRLYDAPETRDLVKRWVDWFKAHRDILESDVVHVRRADGRNLDAVLHVNPALKTKAMAVIYNPVDHPLRQSVVLPLYYAGLGKTAKMRIGDGPVQTVALGENRKLSVDVEVSAKSCVWVTLE
jgi:hypothetical protein